MNNISFLDVKNLSIKNNICPITLYKVSMFYTKTIKGLFPCNSIDILANSFTK